jgi:type IV pilus assembly protein PilY1
MLFPSAFHETRRGARLAVAVALAVAGGLPAWPSHALDLADEPLFSTTASVPGNLLLALSVEWPTATTPAYPSTTAYSPDSTFLGYFDPEKCYFYVVDPKDVKKSYFTPDSTATKHACAGTATRPLWSGNYLNWATMQTLDAFRWVLTGGYRSVDEVANTILTKTFASEDVPSVIPDKTLTKGPGNGTDPLQGATPFKATAWTSGITSRIRKLGTRLWVTSTATGIDSKTQAIVVPDTDSATPYTGQNNYVNRFNSAYAKPGAVYELYINVKVCASTQLLEPNCKQYGSNYKPEGLMQAYASKLRYSAFGYLNHSGDDKQQRDGGVMRARMKFIGQTQPEPGSTPTQNAAAEWDSNGVMLANPDKKDAEDTVNWANRSFGRKVTVTASGVMNYLNKFGNSAQSYKSKDPVSEMYQAALRYFQKKGNVPSYSSLDTATDDVTASKWLDGFPVITQWDDPIQYSCQKNFILGIGDVNTHRDANLNGSTLKSSLEPALPDQLLKGSDVNVQTATDMVGKLEGLKTSATLGNLYAETGGTTCDTTLKECNTYYLAGLAYDAHTRDIRPLDKEEVQTVSTYWMDVMERQVYAHKNQYWLAAKYGGFTVPDDFKPYASTNDSKTLTTTSWVNNSDKLAYSASDPDPSTGGGKLRFSTDLADLDNGQKFDERPDNYFPGNRPDLMRSGLADAFARISSELSSATSTAFSFPSPDVSSGRTVSYSASYDPKNWTGTVQARLPTFDSNGRPNEKPEVLWDARRLLDLKAHNVRLIVTCCDSGNKALPFRAADLSSSDLLARTKYASFSDVPGAAVQSPSNFVAYLRGDRKQEIAKGGAYRTRHHVLGDIVNSKVLAVGPPSEPMLNAFNPGYSAFRRTHGTRMTVIYAASNDGMLHAFDGSVPGSSGAACNTCGQEMFAYIPSFAYGATGADAKSTGLASLGNPSFTHHFLVDGKTASFSVDFARTPQPVAKDPDWRTLLLGGLGKGGRGYYAIDVTNPADWNSEQKVAARVLWEFTDSSMGYSYGAPMVVKTVKYGWVAILTSGYDNTDGKGYFYIVNPRTGMLLESPVATPEGAPAMPLNMAQATAFIPNFKDGTADAVYAGDMQGNVWRLDLTGTTGSYAAPTKIASLMQGGKAQPATTRPLVEIDAATGRRYVLVGTGRLLGDSDIRDTNVQGFYALRDGSSAAGGFYSTASLPNGAVFPLTRSKLAANTSPIEGIAKESALGWYMDLAKDSTSGVAERINLDPIANRGVVAFGVNLPDGTACKPAGKNRVFAMSFATGKSVLVDQNGGLIGATPYSSGMVVDLASLGVDGKTGAYRGDSNGKFREDDTLLPDALPLKLLNWREIQTED